MPDHPDRLPEDKRERMERLREKEARGETLTREEAGFLGAMGAAQKDIRERQRAEREGRLDEWERENGVEVNSWMSEGSDAAAPTISAEDRARERHIRDKEERGETLTHEESGFLGAMERMRQEQE